MNIYVYISSPKDFLNPSPHWLMQLPIFHSPHPIFYISGQIGWHVACHIGITFLTRIQSQSPARGFPFLRQNLGCIIFPSGPGGRSRVEFSWFESTRLDPNPGARQGYGPWTPPNAPQFYFCNSKHLLIIIFQNSKHSNIFLTECYILRFCLIDLWS